MDWIQISTASITAIVGTIVPWYLSRIVSEQERREEEQKQREQERVRHEQDVLKQLTEMRAVIEDLKEKERVRSVREQEKEEQERKRIEIIEVALRAMLRDRIIQSCRHFIEIGSIPLFERENIIKMYRAYEALDGNDIAHEFFIRMQELRIEGQG